MDRLKESVAFKVNLSSNDWTQPDTISDLAVDPRKVDELKSWLLKFRNKGGVLLLTGPTGCGKSATVRCLAKCFGFLLREWVTPLDRDYTNVEDADSLPVISQVEKFEDFLHSCSRYNTLFNNVTSSSPLLLVEDYPNIFLWKPETFHKVLERYCASAQSPLVFICSEVSDKNLQVISDLFPTHLQIKLGISQISFNAVTRARMIAALKRMCALLHRMNTSSRSTSFKSPSQESINEICDNANGDVRYALLLLQIKPQEDSAALFDMAMKPKVGKSKNSMKFHTKEDIVVASCEKDDRVGMLHAVGRVLNPKWHSLNEKPHTALKRKRTPQDRKMNATKPGVELIHSPSSIVNSFLSTASGLTLLVQENYLKTFSSIDSVAAAASCLSLADILMSAESYDIPHEISFDVGIRGVMISNQVPNRAWNPITASKHYGMIQTQKEILNIAEALFRQYPSHIATFMTEYIPLMSNMMHLNFSRDQNQFVSYCASMEPLAKFCESFKSTRHLTKERSFETCKGSFLIVNDSENPPHAQDFDELHISEDESDEEIDEGSQNLTLLEAAIDEDEKREQEQKYLDLLNDTEDDILLSQL